MLQNMRDKIKGATAGILVAILIVPLAFFGIDSLFFGGGDADQAASVNKEVISQFEVEQGVALRRQQILSQFEGLDPALLGDEQLMQPVLDGLIRDRVVSQAAQSQGMAIPETVFHDVVVNQDAFQRDNRFDPALYEYLIGRMGYTPKTYRQVVERELRVNQFMRGVSVTAFTTPQELEHFIALNLEQRDFQYLTLPLERFSDQITIADDDIDAYYQQHAAEFDEAEKVSVDYIVVTPDSLAGQITISEQEIRAQFDAEQAAQSDTQRWTIAHIQLPVQPDDDRQATVAELQQRLADGEDFADLAKEYSDDAGSARQGGLLGTFTSTTLPAGFESAVAALAPGEVSDPVISDDSVHLIRLIERSEDEQPRYDDEQRQRIRDELIVDAKQELLPRVVESLKEKTFNADDLSAVAEDLDLELGVSELFTRAGGTGIAASPAVVEAAFGDDVLEHGFASEVLELQDQQFVVIKLRDHQPARRKSLNEVREHVVAVLTAEQAGTQAKAEAGRLATAVASGKTIEELAVADDLKWQAVLKATRFDAPVDPVIVRTVFAIPEQVKLPYAEQVVTSNGDVVVLALSRIRAGDGSVLSDEERHSLEEALQQQVVSREWRAYEDTLQMSATIK